MKLNSTWWLLSLRLCMLRKRYDIARFLDEYLPKVKKTRKTQVTRFFSTVEDLQRSKLREVSAFHLHLAPRRVSVDVHLDDAIVHCLPKTKAAISQRGICFSYQAWYQCRAAFCAAFRASFSHTGHDCLLHAWSDAKAPHHRCSPLGYLWYRSRCRRGRRSSPACCPPRDGGKTGGEKGATDGGFSAVRNVSYFLCFFCLEKFTAFWPRISVGGSPFFSGLESSLRFLSLLASFRRKRTSSRFGRPTTFDFVLRTNLLGDIPGAKHPEVTKKNV